MKLYRKIFDIIKKTILKFKPIRDFHIRFKFQFFLGLVFITALYFIISYTFDIKYLLPEKIYSELGNDKDPFYLRNIVISLAAIATAIFTWWKNNINQSNNLIQEDSRLDELYAKAIEYLKEDNDLTMRKGGVHILKDLAMTSPKHTQKCIDMICSLNEKWMPKFLKDFPNFFELNNDFANIKNIEEIKLCEPDINSLIQPMLIHNEEAKIYKDDILLSQLVLNSMSTIINHISKNDIYKEKYNLSYKYLCSINLSNYNLTKFILKNINLHFANLKNCWLQSVDLIGSNLQFADLEEVNLESVQLNEANLQSSNLKKANLSFANLDEVNFQSAILREANLKFAVLFNANLQKADLIHANLQSTDLLDANFQFAVLVGASLQSAALTGTNFQSANLTRVNFQSADFLEANFKLANLSKANFKYADLWLSIFDSANIESADFTDSKLNEVDFRNAKNLEKAIFGENKKDAIYSDEDYAKYHQKKLENI